MKKKRKSKTREKDTSSSACSHTREIERRLVYTAGEVLLTVHFNHATCVLLGRCCWQLASVMLRVYCCWGAADSWLQSWYVYTAGEVLLTAGFSHDTCILLVRCCWQLASVMIRVYCWWGVADSSLQSCYALCLFHQGCSFGNFRRKKRGRRPPPLPSPTPPPVTYTLAHTVKLLVYLPKSSNAKRYPILK